MKVLLLSMDISGEIPLALGYLKAYSLQDRVISKRVDIIIKKSKINESSGDILRFIINQNPDILGCSCYVWNIDKILKICAAVKQQQHVMKIILGGPEVSTRSRAEEILKKNSAIDIIVGGEGELTFKEVVSHYLTGSPLLFKIDGISYRDNGQIISNKARAPVALDTIPSPYLTGALQLDKSTHACLETQRGCRFRCSYCFYPKNFQGMRYFSLDRVKKELKLLLSVPVRYISFLDPTFNANPQRMKKICAFISQNNSNSVSLRAEVRAELLNGEMVDLLARAGFDFIEVGLQSINENVLKNVNRRTDLSRFKRGILLLNKKIPEVAIQLIFGLPGDNFSGFLKSLKFATSLQPVTCEVFKLRVLPGTELSRNCSRFKIRYNKKPPYDILRSRTFQANRILEADKIAKVIKMFEDYFPQTVSLLLKETGKDMYEFYKEWKSWVEDEDALSDKSYIQGTCMDKGFPEFIKVFCLKSRLDIKFYQALLVMEKRAQKMRLQRSQLNLR